MKKYVLTGGFCVGKTTLLNFLGKKGYQIIEETSEDLINNYYKKNKKYPWESLDKMNFLNLALNKQLEREALIDSKNNIFLDRCVIDRLAFYKFENQVIPSEFKKFLDYLNYTKVFFIERLPFEEYKLEKHRPHSKKDSIKFEKILLKFYKDYKYELIKVPALPLKERVKFIIDKLEDKL